MMKYIFIWFLKFSINFEPFFFTQNMKYIIFFIKEMNSFSHFFLICTLFNSMSACDLVSISWSDIIYNILVMDQIMTHQVLLGVLLLLLLLLSGELLMLSSVGLELRFYLFDIIIYIDTSMRKYIWIFIKKYQLFFHVRIITCMQNPIDQSSNIIKELIE